MSQSKPPVLKIIEFKEPEILVFRILPHKSRPEDLPFEKVVIHLGINHPNFNKRVPLRCIGTECPICEVHKKKEAKKDPDAWKLKPVQRYIYHIQYNNNGVLDLGILSLSFYANEELKNKITNMMLSDVRVFDMRQGNWIEMMMKAIAGKRKYTAIIDHERDSVTDINVIQKYHAARNLDEMYRRYSREQLIKILKGIKLEFKSSQPTDLVKRKPLDSKTYKTNENVLDKKILEEKTVNDLMRLEDLVKKSDNEDFE